MTTLAFADVADIRHDNAPVMNPNHTLQVLTQEEAELAAGGCLPLLAFVAGAAIGYAIAHYC